MPVTIVSCRYHASVFARGLTSAKELGANGRLNGQMNKCYGGYWGGGGIRPAGLISLVHAHTHKARSDAAS